MPIVPFVYKGRRYNRHGLGRLEPVIPVQRAVNRELNSLIMASENLGFPIRYILGGKFPQTIKPVEHPVIKLIFSYAGSRSDPFIKRCQDIRSSGYCI